MNEQLGRPLTEFRPEELKAGMVFRKDEYSGIKFYSIDGDLFWRGVGKPPCSWSSLFQFVGDGSDFIGLTDLELYREVQQDSLSMSDKLLQRAIEEMLKSPLEMAQAFVPTRPLTEAELKLPIRPEDSFRILGRRELIEVLFESWKRLRDACGGCSCYLT